MRPSASKDLADEAGLIDCQEITPRNTCNKFLHTDSLAGPCPINSWDYDRGRFRRRLDSSIVFGLVLVAIPGEVYCDSFGIAALNGKIEFLSQRLGKLMHYFQRVEGAHFLAFSLSELRQSCEPSQIGFDDRTDAGTAYLYYHFATIFETCAVYLGD